MLNLLLREEVQEFIRIHEQDDTNQLVLSHRELFGLPSSLVADQIIGRRKAKSKLPEYYEATGIIYPPGINLEQSSSTATAKFKANICQGLRALDLTGGMGIDTLFLSRQFQHITYVEPSEKLLAIARHNHGILNARNITYVHDSAESFLEKQDQKYDLIYIDPSRRTNQNSKVVLFKDYQPEILILLPHLISLSSLVMIKASPLLDIQQGVSELSQVCNVYVVAVENECKELLFLCGSQDQEAKIHAVDLDLNGSVKSWLTFLKSEEAAVKISFSEPLAFLYEPNAAIMKAGAFKTVAVQFDLKKLAPNTHLYTSNKLVANFPGRAFSNKAEIKGRAAEIRQWFPDLKANVTTRNYPLRPEQLKHKLKLKDGGEKFLLALSGTSKTHLIVAERAT